MMARDYKRTLGGGKIYTGKLILDLRGANRRVALAGRRVTMCGLIILNLAPVDRAILELDMSDPQRETGLEPMVKYNEDGLVPAILQDVDSGEILMMAWMNDGALQHTIETGKAAFYSRSRKKFWIKGESSGHTQDVVEILTDCDQDTLVVKVKSNGPACHVGYKSCFYRAFEKDGQGLKMVAERVFNPDDVYK
jgi:phosphoribosyl-AMP cyclohydrolase